MIEEAAIVVAVEQDGVWVATERKTTCGSCSARMTCGQGLLASISSDKKPHRVKVQTDMSLCEGDQVTLAVSETLLVRSAFLVYMLPLLLMFVSALSLNALSVSEPWIIFAALLGFVAGVVGVRRYSENCLDCAAVQPQSLCTQITVSPALKV